MEKTEQDIVRQLLKGLNPYYNGRYSWRFWDWED